MADSAAFTGHSNVNASFNPNVPDVSFNSNQAPDASFSSNTSSNPTANSNVNANVQALKDSKAPEDIHYSRATD